MTKRYRNESGSTFAGIAPGEEGVPQMPDAQIERHVRRGKLREVEPSQPSSDGQETADNDPDAEAPDDSAPAPRRLPKPGGMSHG